MSCRPIVVRRGTTVAEIALLIYKDLARELKYARGWERSVKYGVSAWVRFTYLRTQTSWSSIIKFDSCKIAAINNLPNPPSS